MWDVIKQVQEHNRRELTLTGTDIDGQIDEIADNTSGLFSLKELNLLRINKSSLVSLPEALGNLTNLTSLVCQLNKLETFPVSVGLLTKLTLLDISSNSLKELPKELGDLQHLATLNVSCNKLTSLPCLKGCKALAQLDASYNELEAFIDVYGSLELLADVVVNNNKIKVLPVELSTLVSLKKLNMENNCITEVPGNLSNCPKLKVVGLCGNALKDRRMRKLVENSRTSPEQVMKYIKQNCPKMDMPVQNGTDKSAHEEGATSGDASNNKSGDHPAAAAAVLQDHRDTLQVQGPDEDFYVTVTKSALELRPHLVCCIVKEMNLQDEKFRKFIALQTKLHDGICKKRLQSTIATHDIAKITSKLPVTEDGKIIDGLVYTSRPKQSLMFVPLNRRSKPVSAARFVHTLQQEAENQRKLQKANSLSGLYKYLQLVEGWSHFPCLLDAAGTVLSVPPLTNADVSKIEPSSTEILLEVTSDKSLAVSKATMTELIQAVLEIVTPQSIVIKQVRVQGEDGGLRCVFPASDDLTQLPGIRVLRPFK
uniref:Leucine-rich repeat-containing protein 47-like n=2 Tax=Hirondellea gigas TaxID=1518452 RepID=A0A2P2I2I5_9CRUS